MMNNWAVTGATGFVGLACLHRLVALRTSSANAAVSPVILGISRRPPRVPISGVRYAQLGDLSVPINWLSALKGIDVLVHTAARVHVMTDTASDPLEEFRRVNVQGTLHMARQAAAAGVKRLVFISTVKVNGENTEPDVSFSPDAVADPQDAYGISKLEAEQGLREIAVETGMEVVFIRPPLVYGPGVKANFASLMRVVKRGWPLPFALVRNQRSLVALANLVDFIVTCATHPQAANQTFLVSDGRDLSTPELIRKMSEAAGVPVRLWPVPVWALRAGARMLGKGDAMQRLCGNLQVDVSKARDLLGWVPPVSVEDGLQACFSIEN
ncbi:UDP-glucose 4-epimerase family protein [Limnohabitans sp. DCL3]|uniref:UDP-glucose 4-epimerase family protein n=1 Tax=Limnohabitans sp. DCL3 TaxID=3374103 RepID=UPI003A84888F